MRLMPYLEGLRTLWKHGEFHKVVDSIFYYFSRLSSNGVPIAIEKCITFISTHGLELEGIYRKNGNKSKEKVLLKQLVDGLLPSFISILY